MRAALTKASCKWASQIVLVNVKFDEAQFFEREHGTKRVTRYSSVGELREPPQNAVVVVEDIIHLTKDEEVKFRYYLNEHAHHRTLKIFCVGHTLFKTSLYGMLPLFNYILFTATPSNLPLLKQALTYFRLEKADIESYVEKFSDPAVNKFGKYYYLNCHEMKMKQLDVSAVSQAAASRREARPRSRSQLELTDGGGGASRNERQLVERFGAFFEDHPEKVKARSLLGIFVKAVPEQCLRDLDLTVKFKRRGGGRGAAKTEEHNVSLIDYINSLLDSSQGEPERDQLVLHAYLANKCTVPKYFVVNKRFKVERK